MARLRDVLDTQLPALDAVSRTPDVVTVAIGGNDVRAYDRATFAADWFHPDDRGHQVWADAFWRAMSSDVARL